MEILLLVGPIPRGDDDVALQARRPRRLCMGQFALGDTVGPVAEILIGRAAELAGQDVDHELASLPRLGAANPRFFTGFEISECLRDGAGGCLAELMTPDAPVVLDQV